MEKKINIAELLKNCQQGMELDCPLFDGLEFDHIDNDNLNYPVLCRVQCSYGGYNIHAFTKYGCFNSYEYSKCVIFPKGKTSWEGFVPPCKFKDGDIVSTDDGIFTAIVCKVIECKVEDLYNHDEEYSTYCHIYYEEDDDKAYFVADDTPLRFDRLANEEEKERLSQAIKEHGYKWNEETKALEKIKERKFDIKTCLNCKTFKDMHQNCPYSPIWRYKDLNEAKSHLRDETDCQFWNEIPKTKTLEKVVEPKFKVGNRIKNIDNCRSSIVAEIKDDCFIIKTLDEFKHSYLTDKLPFSKQDEWELVPNKFDINTLKPFDKVLVRDKDKHEWGISLFSHCNGLEIYKYSCINGCWYAQCIPYEDNKHLLGKKDDCDEYYKNWK